MRIARIREVSREKERTEEIGEREKERMREVEKQEEGNGINSIQFVTGNGKGSVYILTELWRQMKWNSKITIQIRAYRLTANYLLKRNSLLLPLSLPYYILALFP